MFAEPPAVAFDEDRVGDMGRHRELWDGALDPRPRILRSLRSVAPTRDETQRLELTSSPAPHDQTVEYDRLDKGVSHRHIKPRTPRLNGKVAIPPHRHLQRLQRQAPPLGRLLQLRPSHGLGSRNPTRGHDR
jgi:hypothetical protein